MTEDQRGNTELRRAVLGALSDGAWWRPHPLAHEIGRDKSRNAVYRCLHDLVGLGLVAVRRSGRNRRFFEVAMTDAGAVRLLRWRRRAKVDR